MSDRSDNGLHFFLTTIVLTRSVPCFSLTIVVSVLGAQLSAQVPSESSQNTGNANQLVCDDGIEVRGGSCLRENPPENAYLTGNSYGSSWACNHGFQRAEDLCEEIEVPVNAYLASTGDHWKCNRLFQRVEEKCEEVFLPENGFVETRFGVQETHCNWGFRKEGQDCVEIEVPENGRLSDRTRADGWECLRGYRATDTGCDSVAVPDHAYLASDAYSGWRCERGFRANQDKCMAIIIPANAHLNRRGDGWECNQPFKRQNNKCAENVPRQ